MRKLFAGIFAVIAGAGIIMTACAPAAQAPTPNPEPTPLVSPIYDIRT